MTAISPHFLRLPLTVSLILLLPLLGCLGCGQDQARQRVLLLGFDGLEWDVVEELTAEGKLPHFQQLRDKGAAGKLKSIQPILSPVVWTSIATGKSPSKHEITYFTVENPQTGQILPITSDLRKSKALWNILTDAGLRVGVIGWWATWPAERINGFMITDHANYHFLHAESATRKITAGNTYPPSLYEEIAPKLARPLELQPGPVREFLNLANFPPDGNFDFNDPVDHFRWAYTTAESHRQLGLDALEKGDLDLLMVYFEGLDTSSHLFGQYYRPGPERIQALGEDQVEAFSRVVEQFYVYFDSILGQFMAAMPEDMNLIVCSDHGFKLQEGKGVTDGGLMELRKISEKAHRIYGTLLIKGPNVGEGFRIRGAHVYDIAPTVLDLLGLPVGEDMDGRALGELYGKRGSDIEYIATYETGLSGDRIASSSSDVDPAILEKLGALGYIGGDSPSRLSNLGTITLEEGETQKALDHYLQLLPQRPEDPGLLSNIGVAYGRMGQYKEAEQYFRKVIEIDPRFAEGHSNLALICERTERLREAQKHYLRAAALDPQMQEAGSGLQRVRKQVPTDWPAAQKYVDQAAQLAKEEKYQEALVVLESAIHNAPEMVSAYHFQSNVYYLTGNREKAVEALEIAIALDPDNELYRNNLKAIAEKK